MISEKTDSFTYSVIIPCYQAEKTIGACLTALFQALPENSEVIISDDGSSDRTVSIAREFPCEIIELDGNFGAAAARNSGIQSATKSIILFIDADVIVPQTLFKQISSILKKDDTVDAVVGMFSELFSEMNFPSKYKLHQQRSYHLKTPYNTNALFTAISAVKKSVFDNDAFKEGIVFDETIKGALTEDVELGKKLVKLGYKIIFSPKIQVRHLKKYTFCSLFKTQIQRSFAMGQLFAKDRGIQEIKRSYRFLSVPLDIGFSLAIAPFFFVGLVLSFFNTYGIFYSFFSLMLLAYLQKTFLKIFYSQVKFSYFLLSILFLPIDFTVCFLAAIIGGIVFIFKRDKGNKIFNKIKTSAITMFDSAKKSGQAAFIRLSPFINRNQPVLVSLFITAGCNLKCRHCFYTTIEASKEQNELRIDEIEKISKGMPDFPWIIITGGEPFLRKDINEITRLFVENNHVTNVTVPTNGFYLKRILEWINTVKEFDTPTQYNLNFSIYGSEAIHDEITNQRGSYRQTLHSLEYVHKEIEAIPNIRTVISVILMKHNQHVLLDTIADLRRKYPDTRVNLGLIRGIPREAEQLEIDPEIYLQVSQYIDNHPYYDFDNFFLGKFFAARDKNMHKRIYFTLKKREHYRPCLAGKLSIVIDEHGSVYICELINKAIGNLREVSYDYIKLLNSVKRLKLLEDIRKNRCSCTHECNQTVNNIYDPFLLTKTVIDFFIHYKS